MTNSAGEEFLITHIALGFNNEPLTNLDLPSVKITIFDSAGLPLAAVTNQSMTWNPTPTWSVSVGGVAISGQGWFEYLWNSAGVTTGTYRGKVTLTGVTGGKNFEVIRIRLARDPLP